MISQNLVKFSGILTNIRNDTAFDEINKSHKNLFTILHGLLLFKERVRYQKKQYKVTYLYDVHLSIDTIKFAKHSTGK